MELENDTVLVEKATAGAEDYLRGWHGYLEMIGRSWALKCKMMNYVNNMKMYPDSGTTDRECLLLKWTRNNCLCVRRKLTFNAEKVQVRLQVRLAHSEWIMT